MKNENNYELIKFEDGDFSLDVNVSPNEETVWLTQAQIAELYAKARNTITEHINKIFKDDELSFNSVCRENRQTASDGKTYTVKYYNLDMILAVGYRIKSSRGNMFRRWANSVLKQYLVNGYTINENRCLAYGDNIIHINNTINHMNSTMNDFNDRLTNVELRLDTSNSIDIFKDIYNIGMVLFCFYLRL